jgi:acetolactate decarboxylase
VDAIVQIAPLERLNQGGYDGTTTVAEIRSFANFGIGTLEGLDGEMILLDGIVYHAPANGTLRVAGPKEIIPFATLTRFRKESAFASRSPLTDYAALQAFLTTSIPDQNMICAIEIRGRFKTLKIRAPRKQSVPYPPLTEALKTQAVFELTNVEGSFVGFRFPPYFGTVNAPGYHFHFVSADRTRGGHVLEVNAESVDVAVQTIEDYQLRFPSPAGQ